jgi:citrate synthase
MGRIGDFCFFWLVCIDTTKHRTPSSHGVPVSATTQLCESTPDDIRVRGRSLPRQLMGQLTFTQMIHFHLTGREPSVAQATVLDASLVALMEHGLTPTAVAARTTYTSAPESMQGAVAAGLLGIGSRFIGSMDGCAQLLLRVVHAADPEGEARAIADAGASAQRPFPGFGHPVHRPVDPRAVRLLALAEEQGVHGAHCEALLTLAAAIEAATGSPLPPNITGAIAAVLCDADLPPEVLRGIALISRCAGLVGHVCEEQQQPAYEQLWHGAESAVPYESPEESP